MRCETEGFVEADDGVLTPAAPVQHRNEHFDPADFDALRQMQARHFWYRGRHRFFLHALKRALRTFPQARRKSLAAIDLGAGCGGWIAYLSQRAPSTFAELALADSSPRALEYAASFVDPTVRRYHADLLDLPWHQRWDCAFLLDVLEHIPDDRTALREVYRALRPGGFLFVASPAFPTFWTYHDDLVHHVRRYTRRDFAQLAHATGFELAWSRYYMFFLSPLVLASRAKAPDLANMSPAQIRAHLAHMYRIPVEPLNALLSFVFALETPLGSWLPLPWGNSVLGVFRKPG